MQYNKAHQFDMLADKIRNAVLLHWQHHRVPLGWRYAVLPYLSQLKAEHRDEFRAYLIDKGYAALRTHAVTGSRYLFPPLEANQINDEQVLFAMREIDLRRRADHNRARNERTVKALESIDLPRDAVSIKRKRSPIPEDEAS